MKKQNILAALLAGAVMAAAPAIQAADLGSPSQNAAENAALKNNAIKAAESALAACSSGDKEAAKAAVAEALKKAKELNGTVTTFGSQTALTRLRKADGFVFNGDIESAKPLLQEAVELLKSA